jgi:CheY-like chemotaxis protein
MLIADDDPSIARLLTDWASISIPRPMESRRYSRQAGSSRTLIDVNMPEVDGLSVCAHLLGPDRTSVNVIVITGSRDPDTLERCEGFGAYYARNGPNFLK